MKKNYILFVFTLFALNSYAQNYDFSLSFLGTNSSTGNYQFAFIATPDFEQTIPASTADMGAAFYIPSGYTLGNFAIGNSGLQPFEWANSNENSYDGNITDLVQFTRSDFVEKKFTHAAGQAIELIFFEIISDLGNGNNPTTGIITFADNTDPNVVNNYYESWLNINLQEGSGTQDYFGIFEPLGRTINFETLATQNQILPQDALTIYPNPASDIINIKSSFAIKHIELYDILGKQLLNIEQQTQIDVSSVPSGVYLMKLVTDKGQITKKIVVDR